MDSKHPIRPGRTRRQLLCATACTMAATMLPMHPARGQALQKVTIAFPTRSGASLARNIGQEEIGRAHV